MTFRDVLGLPVMRRVWYAQLVSLFGDFLALFAVLSVVTYRMHGTPTQVTGVSIAYMLPLAVLGPLSGVFVDRWPIKPTLVASDLIRAVLALLLFLARLDLADLCGPGGAQLRVELLRAGPVGDDPHLRAAARAHLGQLPDADGDARRAHRRAGQRRRARRDLRAAGLLRARRGELRRLGGADRDGGDHAPARTEDGVGQQQGAPDPARHARGDELHLPSRRPVVRGDGDGSGDVRDRLFRPADRHLGARLAARQRARVSA